MNNQITNRLGTIWHVNIFLQINISLQNKHCPGNPNRRYLPPMSKYFASFVTAHLKRLTICALLSCSSLATAQENADPFHTEARVPRQPALFANNGSNDPCPKQIPGNPLNLLDVVNIALCDNPQTRVAWQNSRIQAAQVGVNQAAYLPSVNASISADHNLSGGNQRDASITLSYLLYDFGARDANLENARQLLAAAGATQDSIIQTVFLSAVQAFYQVRATQAALDAAVESERAAAESLAAAQARYAAGVATPADKLQAQTAYSQATLNRISAAGSVKNAQGVLANALGRDANQNVPLVVGSSADINPGFEADVNALIEEARRQRPDLLAAGAQVAAAKANADAVRAAGKPTISLNASSNHQNFNGIDTHDTLVGFSLDIPIFSGYASTYQIRSANEQVGVKNAQFEQLRLQIALDVWTAYQNLTTATQTLRSSADLLASASESENVALGRYKAGVGNILDLLNAQSALASARQQRIQATFNWNISRATLGQSIGNLDAGLLQSFANSSGSTKE